MYCLHTKQLINEAPDVEVLTHEKTISSTPTHLPVHLYLAAEIRSTGERGRQREKKAERGDQDSVYTHLLQTLPAHCPSPCPPPSQLTHLTQGGDQVSPFEILDGIKQDPGIR